MIFNVSTDWTAQANRNLKTHLKDFENASREIASGEKQIDPTHDMMQHLKNRSVKEDQLNVQDVRKKLEHEASVVTDHLSAAIDRLLNKAETIEMLLMQAQDGLNSEADRANLQISLSKAQESYDSDIKLKFRGKALLDGTISATSNIMTTATYGDQGQALTVLPLTSTTLADKMEGQLSIPVLSSHGDMRGTGSEYIEDGELEKSSLSTAAIGLSGVSLDVGDNFKIGNLVFTLRKNPSLNNEVEVKFNSSGSIDQEGTINNLLNKLAVAQYKGNQLYDFSYDRSNKVINVEAKVPGKTIADGVHIYFERQGLPISKNGAIVGMSLTAGGSNNNIDVSAILNNEQFIGAFPQFNVSSVANAATSSYDLTLSFTTANGIKYSGTLTGLSASSPADGKWLTLDSENGQGGSLSIELNEQALYNTLSTPPIGGTGAAVIQKKLNNIMQTVVIYQNRAVSSYAPEGSNILDKSTLSFNSSDIEANLKVDKVDVARNAQGTIDLKLGLNNGKTFSASVAKIDAASVLYLYKDGDSTSPEFFTLYVPTAIDVSTEAARNLLQSQMADALSVGQAALEYRSDIEPDAANIKIDVESLKLQDLLGGKALSIDTTEQAALSTEAMRSAVAKLKSVSTKIGGIKELINQRIESLSSKEATLSQMYNLGSKADIAESSERAVNASQGIKQSVMMNNMTLGLKREVTNLVQGASSAA